jgi:hypothetical protein
MRKGLKLIAIALVVLIVSLFASEITVIHFCRWKASQILTTVRGFHPGITTQSQALEALKPFKAYRNGLTDDPNQSEPAEVGYTFNNFPPWFIPLAKTLSFLHIPIPLPWTQFTVEFSFVEGYLAETRLNEMQEDQPGYPHPNSVLVTILSSRLAKTMSPDFNGYSEFSRATGSTDIKGNLTGFECCHQRFIRLDERATPTQFSRSLNFQLHCLTSFTRCKDDHQILP